MPTIFTRIIDGEIPGRFVWRDDRCVAFLTIAPLAPGHTLVVPREEIPHWIDLPADLASHVWAVSQTIGQALDTAFAPVKVGVLVVGEEVPHTHIHLVPFHDLSQMSFANADPSPDPSAMDDAAERIRVELRAAGRSGVSD